MSAKWGLGPICQECSDAERVYAEELRAMAMGIAESLNAAAELLSMDRAHVSRILQGTRMPRWETFTLKLHDAVRQGPGAPISRKALYERHESAKRHRTLRELLQQVDEHGGAVARRDVAAAVNTAGCLPVPRTQGDRQALDRLPSSVRALAERAAELEERPEALLYLLQQSVGLLIPEESAAAVCLLRRQGHSVAADSYIQIYAREQPCSRVLAAALALLDDYRMICEASAMMRAALETYAGAAGAVTR